MSPFIDSSAEKLEACAHCGEICPAGAKFCCAGCETVYGVLAARGLTHFYQLRDQLQFQKPRPISTHFLVTEELRNCKDATLFIEGIHCLGCLWLLERLPEIDQRIQSAHLDLGTQILHIRLYDTIELQEALKLINSLGYSTRPIRKESLDEVQLEEQRSQLIKIAIAAACAGNIMLLAVSLYAGAQGWLGTNFQWLCAMISIPALTYSAWPIYRAAFLPIMKGRITVDLPIAFAILSGIGLSIFSLLFDSGKDIYFDSMTMLVFLLLSSRYVLARFRLRLGKKSAFLEFYSYDLITRLEKGGKNDVPASDLKPGDVVLLNPNQMLPVDGKLQERAAHFDLSALTGESKPISFKKEDVIEAGSRALDPALILVISDLANSRLGKILAGVRSLRESRIAHIELADRLGKYFAITVILISSAILLYFARSDFHEGLRRAMAFAIVTCPCVLAFAVPLTFLKGLQIATENGILMKDPGQFETLTKIRNIFLDKTGTITRGDFQVIDWEAKAQTNDCKNIVFAMEKELSHPLAKSILRYLEKANQTIQIEKQWEIPGKGIAAIIDGQQWTIKGLPTANDSETCLSVCRNQEEMAQIKLSDSLRPDSSSAVVWLQQNRFELALVSGDHLNAVAPLAKNLSINKYFAGITPEQKAEILKPVPNSIMIGDGANDAVAFQAATIGIAVQGSVELSLKNADIVFLKPGISPLATILSLSKQVIQILRVNFCFTIGYNILAGTLAILGFMSPLWAAIIMPLSASTVFLFTEFSFSRGSRIPLANATKENL